MLVVKGKHLSACAFVFIDVNPRPTGGHCNLRVPFIEGLQTIKLS